MISFKLTTLNIYLYIKNIFQFINCVFHCKFSILKQISSGYRFLLVSSAILFFVNIILGFLSQLTNMERQAIYGKYGAYPVTKASTALFCCQVKGFRASLDMFEEMQSQHIFNRGNYTKSVSYSLFIVLQMFLR